MPSGVAPLTWTVSIRLDQTSSFVLKQALVLAKTIPSRSVTYVALLKSRSWSMLFKTQTTDWKYYILEQPRRYPTLSSVKSGFGEVSFLSEQFLHSCIIISNQSFLFSREMLMYPTATRITVNWIWSKHLSNKHHMAILQLCTLTLDMSFIRWTILSSTISFAYSGHHITDTRVLNEEHQKPFQVTLSDKNVVNMWFTTTSRRYLGWCHKHIAPCWPTSPFNFLPTFKLHWTTKNSLTLNMVR